MNRGKPAKYPQAAAAIRKLITEQHMTPGAPLPPERELARLLDCNHLTVRKALKQLEAEQLLHTVPSVGSFAGPRPAGSGTAGDLVGFIFPDDEIFYYEIFAAVEKLLNRQNRHPVVHLTGRSREKEETLLEYFTRLKAAALVAVPNRACAELYGQLQIPTVFFDLNLPETHNPCILSDDYTGISVVVAHLCDLGHSRIAYIGSSASGFEGESARQRKAGFTDTLKKRGTPVVTDFIKIKEPTREWGYHAARELFNAPVKPTAVCCANDTIAAGVIRYCAGVGRRIPEDCSVTGFGDTRTAQDLGLTSVAQHTGKIAAAIVEMLGRLLAGERLSEKRVIQTMLVLRSSTAIPKR